MQERVKESVRTVVTFTPTQPVAWPEGLVIDGQGNIYVGMLASGEIVKIAPDGAQTVLATFELGEASRRTPNVLVGLSLDAANNVYAVLLTGDTPGAATHGVWRVTPSGHKQLVGAIPNTDGGPNQVALDRHGNVYVTDSWLGVVWRIARGSTTATVWLDDPRLTWATELDNPCGVTSFFGGANGLAFDQRGDLYVASSNRAVILRVKIDPQTGEPTAEEFIQDCARLTALDHMAFDERGNLYVARNVDNEIIRITPDKQIEVLATADDGLDTPSNIAFGTGPATFGSGPNNQTLLYITNHGSKHNRHCVQVLDVGVPGMPVPLPEA